MKMFIFSTYIICSLKIPGFLTEEAEYIGEMLVSDFIEDLQDKQLKKKKTCLRETI